MFKKKVRKTESKFVLEVFFLLFLN